MEIGNFYYFHDVKLPVSNLQPTKIMNILILPLRYQKKTYLWKSLREIRSYRNSSYTLIGM